MSPDYGSLSAQAEATAVIARPFRGRDRAACAWLFEVVQQEIFADDDPEKFSRDRFDIDTRGEELWVADADGLVIGFASLWRPDPFIHYLLIRRDWRGRGIGRLLLNEMLAGVDRPVDLKCRIDNQSARRFYRRNDWYEAGRGHQDGVCYIRYRKEPPHQR